jgi:hypothetical protein
MQLTLLFDQIKWNRPDGLLASGEQTPQSEGYLRPASTLPVARWWD